MDDNFTRLLPHLPFLRRYARALTGDAEAGDRLVSRAIERLRADAQPVTPDAGGRKPLYALLNDLFDAEGGGVRAGPSRHPIEAALARLPETDRRLYLLTSLEALSLAEAGEVVGLSPTAAREHMAAAQEQVRESLIASIMIVEDDAIIAFDLAETVRGMGHEVCGTAATMDAALSTAESRRPTLALMDLRLAHGDSGIDTAKALRQSSSSLPIIFVTAFADELHRQGLEHLGPIIRKPFTREEIERAITQAVFSPRKAPTIPALRALADQVRRDAAARPQQG